MARYVAKVMWDSKVGTPVRFSYVPRSELLVCADNVTVVDLRTEVFCVGRISKAANGVDIA